MTHCSVRLATILVACCSQQSAAARAHAKAPPSIEATGDIYMAKFKLLEAYNNGRGRVNDRAVEAYTNAKALSIDISDVLKVDAVPWVARIQLADKVRSLYYGRKKNAHALAATTLAQAKTLGINPVEVFEATERTAVESWMEQVQTRAEQDAYCMRFQHLPVLSHAEQDAYPPSNLRVSQSSPCQPKQGTTMTPYACKCAQLCPQLNACRAGWVVISSNYASKTTQWKCLCKFMQDGQVQISPDINKEPRDDSFNSKKAWRESEELVIGTDNGNKKLQITVLTTEFYNKYPDANDASFTLPLDDV